MAQNQPKNDPNTDSRPKLSDEKPLPAAGARQSRRAIRDDKPFPVIRKPVPIAESGPLKAPKPGAPVESPPILTNRVLPRRPDTNLSSAASTEGSSDLDFLDLDDGGASWVSSREAAGASLPERHEGEGQPIVGKLAKLAALLLVVAGAGFVLYPRLVTDESVATVNEPAEVLSQPENAQTANPDLAEVQIDQTQQDRAGQLAADPQNTQNLTESDSIASPSDGAENAVSDTSANAQKSDVDENVRQQRVELESTRPLNVRFREQLARLEALVEAGSYDDVEFVLTNMDRTLYGYGAPEFNSLQARMRVLRTNNPESSPESSPESVAESVAESSDDAQAGQQLAAQNENEMSVAERAAMELIEKLAAEKQAAQELANDVAAEEQAAQALIDQVAAEERAALQAAEERVEQELAELQVAEEQAARDLADQKAAEEKAAQELAAQVAAEEKAAQELAAQAAAEERAEQELTAKLAAEALAATEQRAAQVNLAQQRELARIAAVAQQTRADRAAQETARQEELARAAATQQESVAVAESADADETEELVASPPASSRSISDEDLQYVYGRFDELQRAIRDRDIETLINLTDRSVSKVQQFQQMFQNNVSIDAQIKNVSTRDARGEIQGTLVITRLERADGIVTGPPVNLASVTLTSRKDEDGWSVIRW